MSVVNALIEGAKDTRSDSRQLSKSYSTVVSLSLIIIFLQGGEQWYISFPVAILCATALCFPHFKYNDNIWFAICAVLVVGNFVDWYYIDNHKYLITYWAIVIFLSLKSRNPDTFIATNARLLIGLVFTLATLWKVISPDFMNLRFFTWSLLVDERFTAVIDLITSLSTSAIAENHRAYQSLGDLSIIHDPASTIQLQASPEIQPLALFLTWWTLIIEGMIGLLYLHGRSGKWRVTADICLLVFLLTTYLPLPVFGFAGTLAIMGNAQATRSWTSIAFIVTLVIVYLYQLPLYEFLKSAGLT
ncbi:hypothetical protein [Deinococcus enclensis]|uniref:Uncharacterized protein n=1 Tax=Deinococcus enclensis TaxID=1049582 RepID=A0ABT9MIW4_9DEIO|nr:hypothetical protein [Deinococcus enclensis]MDP9766531.1 hypothetical protein [Deinococcus enclensis]